MTIDPTTALSPPTGNSDPIPNVLENALAGSYMSPTYWLTAPVNEVLSWAGKRNPIDVITEKMAGDWQGVFDAGSAVKSLAQFNTLTDQALDDARTTALTEWTGVSADQAGQYFEQLAQAIGDQKSTISQLGTQLNNLAFGMYEASQSVSGLLMNLTDAVIETIINLAAAKLSTAFAGTGIGLLVAGGLWAGVLKNIADVIGIIDDIVNVMGTAFTAAQSVAGLIIGHAGAIKTVNLPALPQNSYHPGGVPS